MVSPKWSKRSLSRLNTCHADLQTLAHACMQALPYTTPSGISISDLTILCGHRSKVEQDKAVEAGFSRVRWPNGKHNKVPSDAIDMAPYFSSLPHIRWGDRNLWVDFSNWVLSIAEFKGIQVRSGVDWDRDGVPVDVDPDENLFDGPHFERID